jgi:lactoylglutathione lyase
MEKLNLCFAHSGLFVRDIETSIKFYCDKLDFDLIHENTINAAEGIVKVAFVRSGDCTIELVQLPGATQRPDGLFDHIAFKVKDIDAVTTNLKKRGIVFETEEITHMPHFFNNGNKWIMFRGPDKEHLEINEIL